MAEIVAEFFLIIGVDQIPPTNVAELIPYLLTIFVGVFLVSAVFSIIKEIVVALFDWRRFR